MWSPRKNTTENWQWKSCQCLGCSKLNWLQIGNATKWQRHGEIWNCCNTMTVMDYKSPCGKSKAQITVCSDVPTQTSNTLGTKYKAGGHPRETLKCDTIRQQAMYGERSLYDSLTMFIERLRQCTEKPSTKITVDPTGRATRARVLEIMGLL